MIRAGTSADLPAIARLEAQLFGPDAWDLSALEAEWEGPGRAMWVAHDLCGYVITMTLGDIVDLQRIGVEPGRQRQGIASRLLHTAIDQAHGERMLLEVSAANNAAVAFYQAHGFSQINTRPAYYRDGTDALILKRELGVRA